MKKLRQVSLDIIVDSAMPDEKINELMKSTIRSTLLNIVKARIGITEVKHTLTDKGPMYVPVKELEEKLEEKKEEETKP